MKNRLLFVPLGLLGLLTLFFALGPRIDVSHTPWTVGLPADLETYLGESEARQRPITPGAEKKIIWATSDKRRTALALVYLHGFSATRQETRPLCDQVAKELGANVFYTRLTGHGQGGEALGRATVDAWLDDAEEALAIGERLGERVLLVGCSTGATLATWLAAQTGSKAVLAYVLISPNFSPKDPKSRLLLLPWARQLLPPVLGAVMKSKPGSPEHARYWTTEYPTVALFPMMGLVELAEKAPLEQLQSPVLFLYCPNDKVVDITRVEKAFARWGSPAKQRLTFCPPGSETHVLAGDIRSPEGTRPLAEAILRFVRSQQGKIGP